MAGFPQLCWVCVCVGRWLLTLQGKGAQGAPFSTPEWGSPLSFSQPSFTQVSGEDAVGKSEGMTPKTGSSEDAELGCSQASFCVHAQPPVQSTLVPTLRVPGIGRPSE